MAPTGLPESIPHLFSDASPTLASAVAVPRAALCQLRAALCQKGFPLSSHHLHLPLQLPAARQFLCCSVPSPSCFLPAFFQQHCQGNWASPSTARSDTAPLTAATSSSTSAQPTCWEHQHCQGTGGWTSPPRPAVLLSLPSSHAAGSQREKLLPKSHYLNPGIICY